MVLIEQAKPERDLMQLLNILEIDQVNGGTTAYVRAIDASDNQVINNSAQKPARPMNSVPKFDFSRHQDLFSLTSAFTTF